MLPVEDVALLVSCPPVVVPLVPDVVPDVPLVPEVVPDVDPEVPAVPEVMDPDVGAGLLPSAC
jgi:hypothetical protein